MHVLPYDVWRFGVTMQAGTAMLSIKIGLVGAGRMATALARGFVGAKLLAPSAIVASDPIAAARAAFEREVPGARVVAENGPVVSQADVVILAVKPQDIDAVLREIRPEVTKDKLLISIAAGVSLRRLESALGPQARVVRVMPNTPALVGKGAAVAVRGARATAADERLTLALFGGVGEAVAVRREALMDPVTGLSGSGPAYVYLFAEALIEGGVREGLPEPVARRLAFQTLEGAAAMLKETRKSPAKLREMVSSPGGTTVAGLARLAQGRFRESVSAAVCAATRRSRELGAGS